MFTMLKKPFMFLFYNFVIVLLENTYFEEIVGNEFTTFFVFLKQIIIIIFFAKDLVSGLHAKIR